MQQQEHKGSFPFKARITGPTNCEYEIGGHNCDSYPLEEDVIVGRIDWCDTFPLSAVQIHASVVLSEAHRERLLLMMRWKVYEGLLARLWRPISEQVADLAMGGGNCGFVTLGMLDNVGEPPPPLE